MSVTGQSETGFFEGNERLELFAQIGRPVRKGKQAELAVSDFERIKQGIQKKDATVKTYLNIVHSNSIGMVLIYSEWILNWKSILAKYSSNWDQTKIVEECYRRWRSQIQSDPAFKGRISTQICEAEFQPAQYPINAAELFRAELGKGLPGIVLKVFGPSEELYQKLIQSIDAERTSEAVDYFEAFFQEALLAHDLLVELVALYPTVVLEHSTQEWAEKALRESFVHCSTYEGLWQAVMSMNPEQVAAFLADHLRGHFSGVDRKGITEVIEEEDRYRIVVGPCGSGGAMRRRALARDGKSPTPLPEASAQSLGLKGQMPGYCTHCAVNELESVDRLGYPVLVTEFQADPNKPCGWTIYKDPEKIPQKYFDRLGAKRDPSKFKRLGAKK